MMIGKRRHDQRKQRQPDDQVASRETGSSWKVRRAMTNDLRRFVSGRQTRPASRKGTMVRALRHPVESFDARFGFRMVEQDSSMPGSCAPPILVSSVPSARTSPCARFISMAA